MQKGKRNLLRNNKMVEELLYVKIMKKHDSSFFIIMRNF